MKKYSFILQNMYWIFWSGKKENVAFRSEIMVPR